MSNNPGATSPLSAEMGKPLEASLQHLVSNSGPALSSTEGEKDRLSPSEQRKDEAKLYDHQNGDDSGDGLHNSPKKSRSWISHLWPSEETLDKLFAMEHMGNYVIDRVTGRKIFEAMPLYVRVGMHLLFVSGSSYLSYPSVEKLLEDQSIKQGQMYDKQGPEVLSHIQQFISTYQLPLDELLVTDLSAYPTFNAFFARRLKATARPITSPEDPSIITSPADCRMTVFLTIDQAKHFWIKGQKFSVRSLLLGAPSSASPNTGSTDPQPAQSAEKTQEGSQSAGATDAVFDSILNDDKCSIAIARLAPQDYHRFHSPVEGTVVAIKDIHGELYTVNPQAVNNDLDVFTLNKRSVMLINANLGPGKESVPIAFIAVGAMLVGSIGWSKKVGDKVAKGQELGWFQYGGSTNIAIFPSTAGIAFDKDLVETSEKGMETLVRVGMEIGTAKAKA